MTRRDYPPLLRNVRGYLYIGAVILLAIAVRWREAFRLWPRTQTVCVNEVWCGLFENCRGLRQREEKVMKRALRDKRTMEGHPIEEVFADFEAMQPAEGERRTRKPAKATINSAGTKSQRDAATRARKTATPTTARAKKSIARAKDRTL